MTNTLSTDVFGALVENEQEPSGVASYESYASYLIEQTRAIREQGRKGVDVLRKIGEILTFTRDSTPHGYYQRWLVDMRELYISSGGEDGFNISKATDENYRDLYLVSTAFGGELYRRYKFLGATFLYHQIAPLIKNDHPIERIIEHVEVVRKTPRLLTSGKSDEPCMDNYKEQWPAVYDLFNTGELSESMACDICENVSDFDARVVNIVRHFGVLNLAAAKELNKVADRIQTAKLEGAVYSDILTECEVTNGYISLESGDMVEIHTMTEREIKAAFAKARKEEGASKSAQKSLLKAELSKEEAVKLCLEYGEDNLDEKLNNMSDDTTFTLKLTFEPIETE